MDKLIDYVEEGDFAKFRKPYKEAMKKKYEEKMNIVKKYVYKCISNGKPTHI